MLNLYIITDYKNNFGSKWKSLPYRSGYDKVYLKKLFLKNGYDAKFMPAHKIDFQENWDNRFVLYTSSEEKGLHFKDFIDDVVYGLQLKGAQLLPSYEFLKANNNKVFMEIYRDAILTEDLRTIQSRVYGTFEELLNDLEKNAIDFPCVLKKASGAMSRGVFLAKSNKDLKKKAKKLSYSSSPSIRLKEFFRKKKHEGYLPESNYQHKFIIQPFIPGLTNDWKILIYAEKYFILRRNIRENDFRASGSGLNYTSGSESGFPLHMLNMVRSFYKELDIPHLSVDFAYDGEKGYIFEFQGIHFGTSTHYKSKDYYEYENKEWVLKSNDLDQEQVYVHSIIEYLKQKDA